MDTTAELLDSELADVQAEIKKVKAARRIPSAKNTRHSVTAGAGRNGIVSSL